MSSAKVKFKTDTGMSGSIEGNIPGVCQELFVMIRSPETRVKVMEEIKATHDRLVEYEATKPA